MKNKNMTKRDLEKLYDDWEIPDGGNFDLHGEFPRNWQARPFPEDIDVYYETH